MKCTITGVELPPHQGRGRPKIHYNAKARKLYARMIEVERLASELAEDPGFTEDAEKKFRGWGFSVGNALNRNVLKTKKRNPKEYIHRLLVVGRYGERFPVCGMEPRFTYIQTNAGKVAVTPLAVSEEDGLVDCPHCRRANIVPTKSSR